jgi:hypothetical protein
VNITAALFALISSYPQHGNTAASRTPLKFDSRIKFVPARTALAPVFGNHGKRAVTLGAAAAKEHDQVIELLCPCNESLYRFRHIKCKRYNIHCSVGFTSECSSISSAGF